MRFNLLIMQDLFLPARKTVKFSPNHPILVSGDIKGDIKVYRIFGKGFGVIMYN